MESMETVARRRILLVDNDVVSRVMLGLVLTEEGYEVVHADSGLEAANLHRREPFDLVIAEVMLKEKNGFETLMTLCRNPKFTRIIATAKSSLISAELSLRMARQLGAHFTLAKPFASETLLATVKTALLSN
jgi:DNA-binding response OmpR family regulator